MRIVSAFIIAAFSTANAATAGSLFGGMERTGSALSYGINFHDDDGGDPFVDNFTQSLVYRMDYALGGDWALGVSLGYAHETYDADYYSERFSIGFFASRPVGPGTLGAYFIAGTNTSSPEQEYGLEGSIDFGKASIESYFGVYLEDGDSEGTFGAGISYELFEGWNIYGVHRRDYYDTGFDGLTTLGVTYALAGGDSTGPSSLPPLLVSFEMSKFHDEDDGLSGSGWQQYSLSLTYLFDGGQSSLFRGVRTVDYFYD